MCTKFRDVPSNLDNISTKVYKDCGSRRASQMSGSVDPHSASNFSLTTNKASEGHEVRNDMNNSPMNHSVNHLLDAKNSNVSMNKTSHIYSL